jgi:hypothetical protein
MATESEIAAACNHDRIRLLEGQKRRNALWSAAQRKQAFGTAEPDVEQIDIFESKSA